MSMTTWDDRYLLGLPAIDQDHRILFDLINQLHDAYAAGSLGAERLDIVFNVLGDYVGNHFFREEEMMRDSAYPDMVPHMAAHARFSAEVDKLFHRYRDGGDEHMVLELLALLSNWWRFHVQEDDAAFGRFATKAGPAA
jgi:hemerythrin